MEKRTDRRRFGDTSGFLESSETLLLSQARLFRPKRSLRQTVTPARYLRGLDVLRSQEALEGPRARLDLTLLGLRLFV